MHCDPDVALENEASMLQDYSIAVLDIAAFLQYCTIIPHTRKFSHLEYYIREKAMGPAHWAIQPRTS